VAFGAPIGGILFSFEELSCYFPHRSLYRAFYCAMCGIIVISFLDPLQTKQIAWFQVDSSIHIHWGWYEVFPFAFLGICGGLIGVAFIRSNMRLARLLEGSKLSRYPIVEIIIIAFLTNLVRFPFDPLRVSNYMVSKKLFVL
jgi:chloride channel 3/4/5